MTASFIRARPRLGAALALLEAQGLPTSDLSDEHMPHFFYLGADSAPSALIGVELHGESALLRSLVVRDSDRGNGMASALMRHAEHYAAEQQAKAMYLLTTTAERYFEQRGY